MRVVITSMVCTCMFLVIVTLMHIFGTPNKPTDGHYAWWLIGNTSMFSPYAMSNVVQDPASPLNGLWIPPQEWLPSCTRSYGVPMTACSFFQALFFPKFMYAFYIIYYLLEVLGSIVRLTVLWNALYEVYMWFKLNGPMAWHVTYCQCISYDLEGDPQKLNRARGGNLFRTTDVLVPAICTIAVHGVFLYPLYTLFGPGLGIIHSLHSGLPYFGAGWSQVPLPPIDELADLHVVSRVPIFFHFIPRIFLFPSLPNNYHFHTALHSSFGYLNFQCEYILLVLHFLWRSCVGIQTLARKSVNLARSKVMPRSNDADDSSSIRTHEQKMGYPKDCSLKEYCRWFCCGPSALSDVVFVPLYIIIVHMLGSDAVEVYQHWITLILPPLRELFWTRKWLEGMHFLAQLQLSVMFVTTLFIVLVVIFQVRQLRSDATVGMGASFQNRIKGLVKNTAVCLTPFLIFLILNFLFMPNGALLQMIGLKLHSTATDPAWMYGSSDSSTSNLLAAPIIRLLSQILLVFCELFIIATWSPWTIVKKRDYSQYRGTRPVPAS